MLRRSLLTQNVQFQFNIGIVNARFIGHLTTEDVLVVTRREEKC